MKVYHYIRMHGRWWPYRGILWSSYPRNERWATTRKLYSWMTGNDGMPSRRIA